MYNRAVMRGRSTFQSMLLVAAISAAMLASWAGHPQGSAQSATTDWQKAAGGKMSFEVASVKLDNTPMGPGTIHSNIDLSPLPGFAPTGGHFSVVNYGIGAYISFAYKMTGEQNIALRRQLPQWTRSSRYDIEARSAGDPTKDQFRLMMQSLLADRFKLALHFETKPTSVMTLVVNKPGKLGLQLRPHDTTVPCVAADSTTEENPQTIAGGFPEACGQVAFTAHHGQFQLGARDISIQLFANYIGDSDTTGLTKPIVDGTGLKGNFDFTIDFVPPDQPPQYANGPTFFEALKDQLGLKVESGHTAPVETPVIDHIEQLTPN